MTENSARVKRLLNTVKGQLDGICKMLEENRDVTDVANQVLAIQAILSRVNNELLSANICNTILGEQCQPTDEQLDQVRNLLGKIL